MDSVSEVGSLKEDNGVQSVGEGTSIGSRVVIVFDMVEDLEVKFLGVRGVVRDRKSEGLRSYG